MSIKETDDQLKTRIWEKLESNTESMQTVPEKFQRFNWQNMANLRGAFREGPNKCGRLIDTYSHERLVGAMWELCDIESQINRWFEQRNAQVSAWEKSVKDNPPQRVI